MQLNLKTLKNQDLHQKLLSLSQEERTLGIVVLQHLKEVERRKLHAEYGYPSLFEYAVDALKYSESAAQRRIASMRALKELPELEEKVQAGELKVTQLAQVQSFFRQELKAGNHYSREEKLELVQSTLGKSTRETEKLLLEKSPLSVVSTKERVRALTPTLTQVTFTVDENLMKEIESIRNRFAHQLPSPAGIADVIRFMARVTLSSAPERKKAKNDVAQLGNTLPDDASVATPAARPSRARPKRSTAPGVENFTRAEAEVDSGFEGPEISPRTSPLPAPVVRSRYVPVAVKREVWSRDQGQCAFVSPLTKKQCTSRHRLEIDHVTPFALGGSSRDAGELRLLCSTHNQYEARRILGRQVMRRASAR